MTLKRDKFTFRGRESQAKVTGFRYSKKPNYWRFIASMGGRQQQRSLTFVSSVCAKEYGELWLSEIERSGLAS